MSVPEIPCEMVDVPEGLSKNTVTTLRFEMRCGELHCRAIRSHLATDRFFERGNDAWEATSSSHDEVNVALHE